MKKFIILLIAAMLFTGCGVIDNTPEVSPNITMPATFQDAID
jgi:uncharacterized lipoprotein YajG